MKRVILILFITFFSIQSCENNYVLQGNRIEVNNNVKSDKEIVEFITPYKNKVDSKMDSILAYSPTNYDKKNGLLNTAIGNMMADVALKLSNPVYKARKNRDIDFVLLNHGGIRASISKGDITTRTAYNVMPFENSMVVCELDGETVEELINYLKLSKKAHPISGINIVLDNSYNLIEAKINDKEISKNKIYSVATTDYLLNGGDKMDFFKKSKENTILDYKLRNILIDYFKQIDTLSFQTDNRFIIRN
ncbi:MAG: 5'-nucleotidase [Bacteroidota bacterium]|nr:5'-nucleotidase [Bacteroidota bacterium]|tara:strand:- start:121 stop:867 length:747 start_codon:yes stop_codon:yes gene_type:complete